MKFAPAQIRELAENARFPAENLEKVLRLRELLIEFQKHTILKGKLVLKGGTALNLFYLNLARLSVDIDLNYIGRCASGTSISKITPADPTHPGRNQLPDASLRAAFRRTNRVTAAMYSKE